MKLRVVANLVGQLALAGALGAQTDRRVHPVGAAGDHLADGAVVNLLDGLLEGLVVAAHQTAGDLEVLLLGGLAGLQDAAHAGGVDAERLLHEDMAALRHGVFDVDWPEGRRRGQQDDASRGDAVDRLAVGVGTEELPVAGNVDLV